MIEAAAARGLSGVAVTEHYRVWTPSEVAEHSRPGLRVYAAAEVATDIGHVLVYGLAGFPQSRSLAALVCEASEAGAALVFAHPFRGRLDYWQRSRARDVLLDERAALAGFHAIEVCNSGCTDTENQLAMAMADKGRTPAVAGSDAHLAVHVGSAVTTFEELPVDSRDLAARLISGTGIIGIGGPGLAPGPRHAFREELPR